MSFSFLDVPATEWIASNATAFAIADGFPVSPGHTLVIPKRVVKTWWDATAEERRDLLALVDDVKAILDARYPPDGYNVGFNAGAAAGQTVDHLHIHVIPRYVGDVADPRGGVRHVIPGEGNYLAPPHGGDAGELELVDGAARVLKLELLRCLRNELFDRIDLVVSFIMKSGLQIVDGPLEDALARGARARVLTTDYLRITDVDALARLLDLADGSDGALAVRVFHDDSTSFHPKAYLFWSSDGTAARAFVGSSNLSAAGIGGGVEWNIGVEQVAPMLEAFERLWRDPRSLPLTGEWLKAYRSRPRPAAVTPVEVEIEPPAQPASPTAIQREALDALEQTRLQGHRAGLVVMATGLGKTWLAAFDSTRPEFRRVLFVAHREEILRQSRDVYRRVRPDADLGLFHGAEKAPHADVVFASIQTLAGRLGEFRFDAFDYVVVDEFHHAAAASYRRVLAHFEPRFLLGLTATPDRMDGADLLALCGDNLVFERDLVAGVREGALAPFHYFGIKDPVDFEPIPWRSGRFDPEALEGAVVTQERAQRAFDEWEEKGGGRTLGFCASIVHAEFMAGFFSERGVLSVAVHSGPGGAPRVQAVEDLRDGRVSVIFTVDVFNEGVDIPGVESVLMLRPTESPVVFLQQLGRGLRKAAGKDALRVVDFVGNHRSFLVKPRTLLGLGRDATPTTREVLDALRAGEFALPQGCSVDYPLDVVEMLESLARGRAGALRRPLEDYCRSHVEEHGERPTAVQAYRAGLNPSSVRPRHDGWFHFLDDLGLLSGEEREVVGRHGDVLVGLEREPINKSYKLVTLQALLMDGTLRSGASITQLAWTAHRIVTGDPRLVGDTASRELPDPAAVGEAEWRAYWRRWPIAAWAGELRGEPGRWFRIDGERLVPTFRVDAGLGDVFDAMVAELVDYRLLRHLFTKAASPGAGEMRCRVSHAGGRPILRLDRNRYPQLPQGSDIAFMADGVEYRGDFVKAALNVARRPGVDGNALHDLLRGWFGPDAGLPGTHHEVVLRLGSEGWVMEPVRRDVDGVASETGA